MFSLIKTESYKKGVAVSTVLNIIAKGIIFLNTLVITYFFGASAGTDIYFYVLSVALLITTTINGIDYLVLIPQYMKLREQESTRRSQEFMNFFIYGYLAIGIVMAAVATAAPVYFYTFFSKFETGVLSSNTELLYIGTFVIIFQLINNLLSAVLVSGKLFSVAIISGLVNSIFSMVFTLLFYKNLGIKGTMTGIAIGYAINFVLLIYLMKRFLNWSFKSVRRMVDFRVWKNIALIQINILPVWLRNYFVLYFLTGLGVGVVTSLNLAQMIAALPEVFILTQVASIAGIKFSELAATKKYDETGVLFGNLIKTLFMLILPLAVIMVAANSEIIQLVFERGSFKKNSVETTAFCFFYFSLLLPAKILDVLFSRLFTSFQLYNISILYATLAHTIITILVYLLFKQFLLPGYFIALLIGNYLILPVTFLIINHSQLRLVNIKYVYTDVFLLFCISGGVYGLIYLINDFLPSNVYLKLLCIAIIVLVAFLLLVLKIVDCTFQKKLAKKIFKKIIDV